MAAAPDDLDDAGKALWEKLQRDSRDDPDPIERRIVEALEQSANEPAPPVNRLGYAPSANGVGNSHD